MSTVTQTVYTLQQNLHVTGKPKPIELQTFFLAKTRQELDVTAGPVQTRPYR